MPYVVSLKQFDGPLDLLLTLISKAKIDIRDIFVSQITEQYLEYMQGVDELDMDSASEFLQMAATLVEIKSRALLPKPPKPEDPDEETPEQALIRQLTEYKAFKETCEDVKVDIREGVALGRGGILERDALEIDAPVRHLRQRSDGGIRGNRYSVGTYHDRIPGNGYRYDFQARPAHQIDRYDRLTLFKAFCQKYIYLAHSSHPPFSSWFFH